MDKKWMCPLSVRYQVTQEWNEPDYLSGGANGIHGGIDLAPAAGTNPPIYSARVGTVEQVVPNHATGGNYVIIKHGDNFWTYYGHLASIDVSVGQEVTTQTQVGLCGDTGGATGIHLHFEVWQNGQWQRINPRDVINFDGNGEERNRKEQGGTETPPEKPTVDNIPQLQLLKINRFMFPKASRKFVQLTNEKETDSLPKYHLMREALTNILSNHHPELIRYINSLQGKWGLEKICCAPVMTLTLTNGKGVQKNYNLADFLDQESPLISWVKGFLGKSNRVEFYFENYLTYSKPIKIQNSLGDNESMIEAVIRKDSLIDQTPKNFDLFVDASKSNEYLNHNQIKQSMDNASFALSQNQLQATNAERNFKIEQDKQTQLNQISQTGARKALDISQAGAWKTFGVDQTKKNIGNAIGIGGALLSGNLLGASLGIASMGFNVGMEALNKQITHDTQNQALANAQTTQNQALAANQAAGEQTFYNSLSTSNLIASNNYENAIANINAGLSDLKNQPDISAVNGSDYNFEMAYDNDDLYCVLYTTHPQALYMIATFYAQFGYSIKRYEHVKNYLHVRSKFNYIKTQGINVQGEINNKWRNVLNMIFDNGITFWKDTKQMKEGVITYNV